MSFYSSRSRSSCSGEVKVYVRVERDVDGGPDQLLQLELIEADRTRPPNWPRRLSAQQWAEDAASAMGPPAWWLYGYKSEDIRTALEPFADGQVLLYTGEIHGEWSWTDGGDEYDEEFEHSGPVPVDEAALTSARETAAAREAAADAAWKLAHPGDVAVAGVLEDAREVINGE